MEKEADILLQSFYGYFIQIAVLVIMIRIGLDLWREWKRELALTRHLEEVQRPANPGKYIPLKPEDIRNPDAEVECWPNGNVKTVKVNDLTLSLAQGYPRGSLVFDAGGSSYSAQYYDRGGFSVSSAFTDSENHQKITWMGWLGQVKASLNRGYQETIFI